MQGLSSSYGWSGPRDSIRHSTQQAYGPPASVAPNGHHTTDSSSNPSNAEAQIDQLKTQNQRLEDTLARLRAEYHQLATSYEKLQRSNADLAKASPNQLERAYRDLLEQFKAHQAHNEHLRNENGHLQQQLYHVQQQLHQQQQHQNQQPLPQQQDEAFDPQLRNHQPVAEHPGTEPPLNNGYAEAIPQPATHAPSTTEYPSPSPAAPSPQPPPSKKRKKDAPPTTSTAAPKLPPISAAPPSPSSGTLDPTTSRWLCPLCPKTFGRRTHMLRHQQAAHSDEKPFVCELCGSGFGRKDHLSGHLRRVHGVQPEGGVAAERKEKVVLKESKPPKPVNEAKEVQPRRERKRKRKGEGDGGSGIGMDLGGELERAVMEFG